MPARPERPPDPVRQHLVEVRRGLLRLHKALIDAERGGFEASRGPLTNTQLLGALLEDPYFAWLRPYSRLIAEIDAALANREHPLSPAAAREFVTRVHAVASPTDAELSGRLGQLRERDPTVLFTATELNRRLAEALLALEAPPVA